MTNFYIQLKYEKEMRYFDFWRNYHKKAKPVIQIWLLLHIVTHTLYSCYTDVTQLLYRRYTAVIQTLHTAIQTLHTAIQTLHTAIQTLHTAMRGIPIILKLYKIVQ